LAISPVSRRLIDLDQELPGQRRFISCWLVVTPGLVFIVDPGPPSTADHLLGELERLGVTRLDFILLTHVHLDHAGCTARVLARWPEARVICHEKGRRHLVDPARLWEGSRAVLGAKAEVYGEPIPVPSGAIGDFAEIRDRGLGVVATPGHASHHLAFTHGDGIFLGECAGTFSDLGRGSRSEDYYLRPATPPRFVLETALASLERVLALDPFPKQLFFGHHGKFTGDTRGLIRVAARQLSLWVEIVRAQRDMLAGLPHSEQPAHEEELMHRLRTALHRVDFHYARGDQLPPDMRERERDFSRQTLHGILDYLRDTGVRRVQP